MTDLAIKNTSLLSNTYNFFSEYFFNAEKKKKAFALLFLCIMSSAALLGLEFILGWYCFPAIYDAFILSSSGVFLSQVGFSLIVALAMTGVNYLAHFFKNKLLIEWRSWHSKKMTNAYLDKQDKVNYLEISRIYPEMDNPDQRIQEDVTNTVELFLELTLGLFQNISNVVLYTILLSMVGASFDFIFLGVSIVIPQFLVITAMIYGLLNAAVGYYLSRKLQSLYNEEIIAKSNFRLNLQQINLFSEEISIENAEKYHKARLVSDIEHLGEKTGKRLEIENNVNSYNLFNHILQDIIPILLAAPLYFKGLISLDVFYLVGYYFTAITNSMSWLVFSFEKMTKFQSSLNRVMQLQEILNQENSCGSTQKIMHFLSESEKSIEIRNLSLSLHGTSQLIVKGINLKFNQGVHTLIQAPSGSGKSSLFKAMAKSWISGEGEIIIPHEQQRVYFLPQRATIPNDILRNVLAYPDEKCAYSDDDLIAALTAVNLRHLSDKLDSKIGFKSLGEQQRLAFARVLLRKPDWVFLDEATASLDEDVEKDVYMKLKERLPNTTIVSIAHRSTVRAYHERTILFKVDEEKNFQQDVVLGMR